MTPCILILDAETINTALDDAKQQCNTIQNNAIIASKQFNEMKNNEVQCDATQLIGRKRTVQSMRTSPFLQLQSAKYDGSLCNTMQYNEVQCNQRSMMGHLATQSNTIQ